jgi:peptidoglycan/LPS O-acetylase OafA/YrhL
MARNVSQLASLNGIRGFAVLLVLLSHASNEGGLLTEDLNFSGAGHYGVFLFFVLSSFLLTRQFLVANSDEILSGSSLRHYFFRRFLRIYPLYFVSLLFYALLNKAGFLIVPVSGEMIVKSLLLLDAEGLFWTIPVEFQFYFFLPLIARLLSFSDNIKIKFITGAVFCGCWTYFFPPEYRVALSPFLPIFVLGALAACGFVFLEKQYANLTARVQRICGGAAICLLLSFVVLSPRFYSSLLDFNGARAGLQHQFVFMGMLSAGLVLSVLCSTGVTRKLMESRFFVFWGKISFSAYLGHKMILAFVTEVVHISATGQFVLFFLLTALLSSISYHYFERPLAKIANVQ